MLDRFRNAFASFVLVAIFSVFPLQALAGSPSGCTDLDGFPSQPGLDFESQIQPIFSVCSGCHGNGGSAGLDLRPGEAYGNLVGVQSTTNPAQVRVQPFEPGVSLLLNAVNCSSPGGPAFQMPGAAPEQRALIRDWIAQGALLRPPPRSIPVLQPFGVVVLVFMMMLVLLAWRFREMRSR